MESSTSTPTILVYLTASWMVSARTSDRAIPPILPVWTYSLSMTPELEHVDLLAALELRDAGVQYPPGVLGRGVEFVRFGVETTLDAEDDLVGIFGGVLLYMSGSRKPVANSAITGQAASSRCLSASLKRFGHLCCCPAQTSHFFDRFGISSRLPVVSLSARFFAH